MENFQEEQNREKKRNVRFLIFVCVVALVGGINIAISTYFNFLFPYLLGICLSIPCGYFNYSLCKLGNRRRTFWTHKNQPTDDEPSKILLLLSKISFWSIYGMCLLLSVIATFL